MEIYIDGYFVINATIDYFLLLGTARICGIFARRLRLLGGACFGALYACLGIIPGMEIASHPAFWLPSAFVILVCAFGFSKKLIREGIVFLALSAAAAGALAAISSAGGNTLSKINLPVLCIVFGITYIILTVLFKRAGRSGARYAKLTIRHNSAEIELRALHDTGNTLTDNQTGNPCAVIPAERGAIFGEIETHLVGYTTIAGESHIRAFIPDECRIDGKIKRITVCLSEAPIADNLLYEALIP